nr:pyridoxal-dependent decarboxylase [Salinispora arenicola]
MPDFSRRARSLPVWATLRTLGRSGVAEQVERCCALARRFADQLSDVPGVQVLNDGPLNQVLVRFGDDDEVTRTVIRRLQNSGDCWFGGTMWQGFAAMRISVSSWQTTAATSTTRRTRIAATVTEVLHP